MRGLLGLRVAIAGGATGVGAAVAKRLGQEGIKMVVGDINFEGARRTADQVVAEAAEALKISDRNDNSNPAKHCEAVPFKFDLSDEDSCHALVKKCADEYGGIDGLVNIGALLEASMEMDKDLLEMDPGWWRRTLGVNLIGYALTTKAVLPYFLSKGEQGEPKGGAIVNISSGSVWAGMPFLTAYQCSKAGVNTLTRYTAKNYGPQNVRANCVAFGAIATEMNAKMIPEEDRRALAQTFAIKRFGKPEEPASLVAYLLSKDAGYITGQVWSCCGGQFLRE